MFLEKSILILTFTIGVKKNELDKKSEEYPSSVSKDYKLVI